MIVQCDKCTIRYNDSTVNECPICNEKVYNEGSKLTSIEIADRMGITKNRVLQILDDALNKLKSPVIYKRFRDEF